MSALYTLVTAQRASNLIYEIACQSSHGIWPGIWPRTWIVPDNVCPAVPLALACAGADLRFVDIDAETLCLDTGKVSELAKTDTIAGVVYVRTYGFDACAEDDLTDLRNALPRDAIIIDDRCMGVPQTEVPQQTGGADAVLFSTGYGKVLDMGGGAYGFFKKGGFFKKDMGFKTGGRTLAAPAFEDLLVRANAAMKTGGSVFADFDFTAPAFSTKHNTVAQNWFELSNSIKAQWPERLTHKAKLNAIYAQELGKFSPLADGYQNWRFHIFMQNQAQTVSALFGAGLFVSSHYAPVSKLWGLPSGHATQETAKNIINLFNDQYFSAKQARQAVAIINEIGKPLRQ